MDLQRLENIARLCHEVNAAYCRSLGDDSQVGWDDAPDWQRSSAMSGVEFHLENPDASASASHDSWLAEKVNSGWVWGETKNAETKTHPCLVAFEDLPVDQQAKDHIFRAIIHNYRT